MKILGWGRWVVVKYFLNKYENPGSNPHNLYTCCTLDPFITAVRNFQKEWLARKKKTNCVHGSRSFNQILPVPMD